MVCLKTKLGLWKAQPKAVRGSLRTSAAVSDLPAAAQRRARKRCAGVGRRAVTQSSGRLSRRPRSNYICSSLPLQVYHCGKVGVALPVTLSGCVLFASRELLKLPDKFDRECHGDNLSGL